MKKIQIDDCETKPTTVKASQSAQTELYNQLLPLKTTILTLLHSLFALLLGLTAHLSTSETEDTDNEFAQRSRSRSSSSSTSSRSSTGHKSRKEYYSSESESESSPLADSFVQNKENRRIHVNSNIMAKSTGKKSTKKAGSRTSQRVQNQQDKEADEEAKRVERMEAELEQLRKDKSKLQNQLVLASSVEKFEKSGGVDSWTDEQKAWYKQLQGAVKKYAYNSVKFINSEQKLVHVTGKIFDKWNLKEHEGLVGNDREEARNAWIAQNSDLVRMAFNDIRNYSQAQLRDFIVELIKSNRPVPTVEDVLACAKRDVAYMTDPEKQKIFDLYVDVLLFKLLGKECWDTVVRHYHCPTDQIDPKDVTKGEYIRVSSEAMVVAIFKNCLDKWKYIADCHKKNTKVDRKNNKFKVDFIESKKGQQKWGGWNEEGRKYHADIAVEINQARAQEHVKEMEKACLQRLRAEHGIENCDAKKKSKKRKRQEEEEKKVEIDDTFDMI